MSSFQFMLPTLSDSRYYVKRFPDRQVDYSRPMKKEPVERSEFAKRLIRAREHAGLTQTALAKAVGMAQSSYGEAETTANSSRKTAQLAARCGVSPEWLATGKGKMLDAQAPAEEARADELPRALNVVAESLAKSDRFARVWPKVSRLLSAVAEEPEQFANFAHQVRPLLPDEVSMKSVSDNEPKPKQFGRALPSTSRFPKSETDDQRFPTKHKGQRAGT